MQSVSVEHLTGLWIKAGRDKNLILFLTSSHSHHHSLSSSCSSIVHRGVGDVHTCEFGHHALILEDIMERALRDLCLIRGVGGKELRTLQQTRNHRGGVMIIYAHASETGELFVF